MRSTCIHNYNQCLPTCTKSRISVFKEITKFCIHTYRNSLYFHCKNIFIHKKCTKIIFMKFFAKNSCSIQLAQKLLYANIFLQKFTRQTKRYTVTLITVLKRISRITIHVQCTHVHMSFSITTIIYIYIFNYSIDWVFVVLI